MRKYTLEEVTSGKQKKEFLEMARRIYKGNRYWVQPLDSDIESVFDPSKNRLFRPCQMRG